MRKVFMNRIYGLIFSVLIMCYTLILNPATNQIEQQYSSLSQHSQPTPTPTPSSNSGSMIVTYFQNSMSWLWWALQSMTNPAPGVTPAKPGGNN